MTYCWVQQLYAIVSLQSGLVLAGQTAQPGTPVVQATWDGSDGQLWLRVEAGGVSSFANAGVVGTVLTAAAAVNGSAVSLQADTGSGLQRWKV